MKTDSPQSKSSPEAAAPSATIVSAEDTAVKALERIAQLDLQPVPQLYELWFRYFQGDPEIVRAIDNHQGTIDENACHKIYKRFLSESSRDDAVKKISDQVQQSITEMVLMLTSVKSATTDYGDTLDDVKVKIESAETLEDLSSVVSSIVEDTKKMLVKNHELEKQLVTSSQQVSELRQNLDNVKKEAMTDGLTGLTNRKAFDKQIRDAVEEAEAHGEPLIFMMLDIDHFKKFNDTYGHQVGDQVLRLVARTLTDNVKGRDTAARYGGEEFVIILPATTLESGLKVAEMLRKSVESKEVINKSSHETLGRITMSLGIAEFKKGESVSTLIERADAALYQAKKSGRNRVEAAK